jgi:CBS-domain-containing membrane protein
MNSHHLRRLPVVDAAGKLVGIVSRCDLLSVFLRPTRRSQRRPLPCSLTCGCKTPQP